MTTQQNNGSYFKAKRCREHIWCIAQISILKFASAWEKDHLLQFTINALSRQQSSRSNNTKTNHIHPDCQRPINSNSKCHSWRHPTSRIRQLRRGAADAARWRDNRHPARSHHKSCGHNPPRGTGDQCADALLNRTRWACFARTSIKRGSMHVWKLIGRRRTRPAGMAYRIKFCVW